MVERTIAWLVARGHRRVRYRGVERNQLAFRPTGSASFNLRRLINSGLTLHRTRVDTGLGNLASRTATRQHNNIGPAPPAQLAV